MRRRQWLGERRPSFLRSTKPNEVNNLNRASGLAAENLGRCKVILTVAPLGRAQQAVGDACMACAVDGHWSLRSTRRRACAWELRFCGRLARSHAEGQDNDVAVSIKRQRMRIVPKGREDSLAIGCLKVRTSAEREILNVGSHR